VLISEVIEALDEMEFEYGDLPVYDKNGEAISLAHWAPACKRGPLIPAAPDRVVLL
jgi:hypothetical protein